ncbi:CNNM domain-containing protein [uncultured Gilvimarinus sp.]|uniref:CNNM domain-containing protein n=1 Tax=uncultured Gilvimarinus sp. TaxID=1689143 RepID=UPI0030EE8BAA
MTLLLLYIALALGVSFLCSIAEAVLLSVTPSYTALMAQEGRRSGNLLSKLSEDVERPLAAILTLNTIAHTIGAAGAGAQATIVFGSAYLGAFSAVLTLLILVLSEIIPKTLGAYYWRSLAPVTAFGLHYLIKLLYPFIVLSEKLTRLITRGERSGSGLNRQELAIAADISSAEGHLDENESMVVKNLLALRQTSIREVMTPRTVLFSENETDSVGAVLTRHTTIPFSRIPIYAETTDNITGLVLLSDLLLAQARNETDTPIVQYRRELPALLGGMQLTQALEEFLRKKTHMVLVVTEFGDVQGIITLEDVLEALLGREIVDENDKTRDMQELARRHWRRQARKSDADIETDPSLDD